MHIFVINLISSHIRRERIRRRLSELGLVAEIFPAIDGRTARPSWLRYRGRRRRLFYGKDLTPGEIGCAYSHLSVYRQIVGRNIEMALVLEDDAILSDDLPQALMNLSAASGDWDLVRFLASPKTLKRSWPVTVLANGMKLCRSYGTPGGAYGYVLNHRAAEKLSRSGNVWMPIDTLHGQVWLHGLRVRTLVPSPVKPDNDIPSTIGDARFSKLPSLDTWERIVFPLTRLGFKVFDATMKQATFWLGRGRDNVKPVHISQTSCIEYYNPNTAWLWCLVFGPFYWLYRKNYRHAAIAGIGALSTAGLLWLAYPFLANKINLAHYRRKGWHDLNADGEQDDTGVISFGRDMAFRSRGSGSSFSMLQCNK